MKLINLNTNRILATIRGDLKARYGREMDTKKIGKIFDKVADSHLETADMVELLPVLVEREATEIIEDRINKTSDAVA